MSSQVESVQKVPGLSVCQVTTKERESKMENNKSKVVGWSTEKMEKKASTQEFKDTEDMVQ